MIEMVKKYAPLVLFYLSIVFLTLAFINGMQTKSAIEEPIQIAQINN